MTRFRSVALGLQRLWIVVFVTEMLVLAHDSSMRTSLELLTCALVPLFLLVNSVAWIAWLATVPYSWARSTGRERCDAILEFAVNAMVSGLGAWLAVALVVSV